MEEEQEQGIEKGWFASRKRRVLLITALLLFMFIVVLTASLNDSPTFDEPLYITAGYQSLRGGNFSLVLERPPLLEEIIALPLAFKDLNFSEPPIGQYAVQNQYSRDFFYNMGNPPDTMLQVSRLPAYLMLVALGLLIYAWGKRVFGYRAALVSLFFFVLTPVFLGDGRLATLDLGATLFMTAAFYSFYLLMEEFTPWRFIATAFLCAATLLSRFNTLIIVLILPLLALIRPFFVQPVREARVKESLLWLARSLALLLVALVIVVTFYGMHTARLTPEQQETNIKVNLNQDSPFTETLLKINRVSPPLAHYMLGLAHDYEEHMKYVQYSRISYWDGKFDRQWRWYYYPAIFVLKMPLALVALFLGGLVLGLRRFRKWGISYILICLAVLVLASVGFKRQLGLRYIMPLIPLVILLAGSAGAELVRPGKGRRLRQALLGVLMLYVTVSVMLSFPSFLSYSNELIVNKGEAYRWLIDSNLDWGQDLRRLADYADANGITDLEIDYFGGGDPLYYLPDARRWSPEMGDRPHGWFALSYVNRQRGFSDMDTGEKPQLPSAYGNWIEDFQPVARIGESILLYYLP
jgi:4-amino-4-deoxy-L-arabinose transferase-like glycosyltransferase